MHFFDSRCIKAVSDSVSAELAFPNAAMGRFFEKRRKDKSSLAYFCLCRGKTRGKTHCTVMPKSLSMMRSPTPARPRMAVTSTLMRLIGRFKASICSTPAR